MNAAVVSPEEGTVFRKLLGAGLGGWLAAMAGLCVATPLIGRQDTFAGAVVWAFSRWWIAFAVGLAALLVVGLATRRRSGRALAAYLIPTALVSAGALACHAAYPEGGMLDDLLALTAVMLAFWLIGWAWMAMRPGGSPADLMLRAVLPPTLGGLAVLLWTVIPVFGGDAFRYRGAFALEVQRVERGGSGTLVEALLEVRKPGNYRFSASRALGAEMFPGADAGSIEWGSAGEPRAGVAGKYPLRVRWGADLAPGGGEAPGPIEDMLMIDVWEVGPPGRWVRSVSASLRPSGP